MSAGFDDAEDLLDAFLVILHSRQPGVEIVVIDGCIQRHHHLMAIILGVFVQALHEIRRVAPHATGDPI